MIVGVCGFVSTGSSAVSDLLKEFDENQVLDSLEFSIAYTPDGLEDLTYNLMYKCSKTTSSNAAIERFRRYIKTCEALRRATKGRLDALTEAYLKQIVQVQWLGYSNVDAVLFSGLRYRYVAGFMKRKVYPRLSRRFGRNFDFYPVRTMEFSAKPAHYFEHTKRYVGDILDAMGWDHRRNLVLDQPFAGSFPQKSFDYFEAPRAIVVDRDPRDQYLFAKKFLLHKGRSIPTQRVEDFVTFYRAMREDMPYLQDRDDMLRIRFEDMVYEYEASVKKIVDFCGLGEHTRPRSIFEPSMSQNNTQLFRRYPEYDRDIQYIERELPQYLYPFEKYDMPLTMGEMFYGRSPLNKKRKV